MYKCSSVYIHILIVLIAHGILPIVYVPKPKNPATLDIGYIFKQGEQNRQ